MSKLVPWMNHSRGLFLALLSLPLFSGGCRPHDGPVIDVTLEFVAPAGTLPLYRVEVMAGGNKEQLADIAPGETARVAIDAFKMPGNNAVVLYIHLAPKEGRADSTWRGERMPDQTSYKTHIQINEKAQVISQRSCVMPCELKK